MTLGTHSIVPDTLLAESGKIAMFEESCHTFGKAIIIVVQLKYMIEAFHNHLSITALDVSIVEESNHHRQDFGRRRAWNYFG